MNRRSSLALTIIFVLSSSLPAAEPIELFDGKTLDGWTRYGGKHEYRVKDGVIIGKVVEGEGSSYLCTDKQFGDFELLFEVKYLVGGVNSGCQIRSLIRKEDGEKNFMKKGAIYGPQVEINLRENNNSGNIYGQGLGTDYLKPQKKNVKSFRPTDWNCIRVVAKGPRIQTWVNGEAVVDIVNEEVYQTNPRGMLGLQIHKVKEGTGPYELAWRNIRIREMGKYSKVEAFVSTADRVELFFPPYSGPDHLNNPATVLKTETDIAAFVGKFVLEPKEPCKCKHSGRTIKFSKGEKSLIVHISDHAFDVTDEDLVVSKKKHTYFKMPDDLWTNFRRLEQEQKNKGH